MTINREDLPLIHKKYSPHHGNERAYMRDIILGIDDGLISTMLLTIGVYASGLSQQNITLSILSSALGGSISMGLGEYLATKSQIEVTSAELELEREHIRTNLKVELDQVRDFLKEALLIEDDTLIEKFVSCMSNNPDGLFNFMKTVEFAITEDDFRNPYIAMSVSGGLYFIGSLPSIISFLAPFDRKICFLMACVLNTISLFSVGTLKTKITKTPFLFSGFENLSIGLIGGLFSYLIGFLFSLVIKTS